MDTHRHWNVQHATQAKNACCRPAAKYPLEGCRFTVDTVKNTDYKRWLIVAPLSIALGALLAWAHVPAAWILGAIVVSGVVALTTGRDMHVARPVYAASRAVIGVIAGIPVVGITWGQVGSFIIPGLCIALLTTAFGLAGGYVLARSDRTIDANTGVLSMLPGGASMMPVLASELGADYRYVSLVQYLRLLIVSVTLPLVAGLFPGDGAAQLDDPRLSVAELFIAAAVVAVLAGVGSWAGRLLHLPVPSVVGPLALTVVVGSFVPADYAALLTVPAPLAVFAFVCIGWICGGGLSLPTLKVFARQLPVTVTMIVLMMAACAGAGWLLTLAIDATGLEGYLATSPGALETVLALASEGHAGAVVVVLQIIRLLTVIVVASYVPAILRRLRR
ncbi:AbrB family transcriptional regulator [Corynebacterium renale]|uniref:AbrB family transcriptional regulator n=1 Tax=Corynebacterium renale TaxID=1724 RepID=UPI0028692BDD|nr:AbrB family transcriptional regulator [Corynebacterium renale]